ncbi:hypothetical protein LIPSTDRAFT_210789 [Lipomyces starkeyi NRRL Y-11557]|uniref:Uncharacterized protein n=1 Tax=Lipomyces starkeyi NRRL Y-11557 TaxID=675824 RepID=A0A1E3QD13_LIPST|nr:hypothetical protein LIPSTDRAFT_210789 [Lipomyces starkeyi NRRL Y-11557]
MELTSSATAYALKVAKCVVVLIVHEWINEIPTVPIYYLAKPQPSEWACHNRREKKSLQNQSAYRFLPGRLQIGLNSLARGQRKKCVAEYDSDARPEGGPRTEVLC